MCGTAGRKDDPGREENHQDSGRRAEAETRAEKDAWLQRERVRREGEGAKDAGMSHAGADATAAALDAAGQRAGATAVRHHGDGTDEPEPPRGGEKERERAIFYFKLIILLLF